MKITMNDSHITNITQLQAFLNGSKQVDLSLRDATIKEKYDYVTDVVKRMKYLSLRKKEKRVVLQYLKKITGYKKAQLMRLITRAKYGDLVRKEYKRIHSHRKYSTVDIKLLEQTDEWHLRLSDRATQVILKREHDIFGHKNYATLAGISHAHISNLRKSPVYISSWLNHTKARQIAIGVTKKPENHGIPGSIRVDTVHQHDVYHINAVDEITQWEVVVCVAQISDSCMVPALKLLFSQFPFKIFNFHSDRGGENINHLVSEFLHRHLIKQTKSRPRKSNDNGLVETKNGSVIRKNMGWVHIHQDLVDDINNYYTHYFNPYVNYHRPSGYPTVKTNEKGKERKVYTYYTMPYEALKEIPEATKILKKGETLEKLDIIAYKYSDNEWAKIVREEERKLNNKIAQYNKLAGSRRNSNT
jgi:hypothetical protein